MQSNLFLQTSVAFPFCRTSLVSLVGVGDIPHVKPDSRLGHTHAIPHWLKTWIKWKQQYSPEGWSLGQEIRDLGYAHTLILPPCLLCFSSAQAFSFAHLCLQATLSSKGHLVILDLQGLLKSLPPSTCIPNGKSVCLFCDGKTTSKMQIPWI